MECQECWNLHPTLTSNSSKETGVRMIVRVQHGKHINMWIFLRPFSWDLWLTLTLVCVFIGVVIRIMERNVNMSELDGSSSSPQREQLTAISILWLPLSQAVIPQRELVAKNCSRFVLVVWLILACVLMQSYTASLSSILTIDRLKPNYLTTNELIRKGYQVGYQNGSFVGEQFLKQRLKFDQTKLKPLDTISDYHHALRNGIVEAIYDEIPYIKVFLKKFGSNYIDGWTNLSDRWISLCIPLQLKSYLLFFKSHPECDSK
ncbi:Glutamate receptor-like protein [Quillaja saponaria]|uniref:Glutamate receptor-like protein n=1 Tax=Quillaja saponaria TaxID=32244 RepID=A0AAD7QDL5_QUISA|nr:Glutamate receptor-like protein [Quillaja saponaria]